MSIRAIPRSAIGGSIKVARLPLDIAVALLPGNGSGPGASAAIAVDRMEAQLRDVAGMALGDEVLRNDAAARRVAADERERALRLRSAAARRTERADERLDDTLEQTDEQRDGAAERARRQRAQAEAQRKKREQQAATAERRRRASAAKAKAKTEEAIDEQATGARLQQLDREAEALDAKAGALTAEAEAQRLQDEATKKKAARRKR
jgi:hypothetical protein